MSEVDEAYAWLKAHITSGRVAIGRRLPSISETQQAVPGTSTRHVRAAVTRLRDEGMVWVEHGRGSFVVSTERRQDKDVAELLELAGQQLASARRLIAAQNHDALVIDLNDEAELTVLSGALDAYESQCQSLIDDRWNETEARQHLAVVHHLRVRMGLAGGSEPER
ncbi:GntR family transcriptional regulator [Pseudoclavibacter sp. RFBA6]|uniref:GntR family transcriptional regulator n=1 Tax=Pseudoclavibacter sp. RFBA6 TaxID=2080573 RepID=UPI000CE8156D|nr:GntR family transcriptional regulator [Pseudoclavibacter sp. RFBA6]PPG43717.1 hypothetical protein C5C17_00335 [Pseudoclavibacter sp. RFBA6]